MGRLDGPLAEAERRRLERIVTIGELFDLRPLLKTSMNATLRLDKQEALAESPALVRPRPEFVRQSELIANIWAGLGAATRCVRAPQRRHYDVVADLSDPDSALCAVFAP